MGTEMCIRNRIRQLQEEFGIIELVTRCVEKACGECAAAASGTISPASTGINHSGSNGSAKAD